MSGRNPPGQNRETVLRGRSVHRGRTESEAMVSRMDISFFGGVDPETGTVVEPGHDLEGQSIAGKVLAFPTGKGSTWPDGCNRLDRQVTASLSGREVDFLVTRNKEPLFLTEVNTGKRKSISKDLVFYHKQIKANHAFQANFAMDYVNADCFSTEQPVIVPVRTLLSQLI